MIGAFNHLLQPISVLFIKVDDAGYLLYKLVGPQLPRIEFPCDFKLKSEIKQEGECCTDNMKSETIIRPKLEPKEALNSGQFKIKGEPTIDLEVKGIKKEFVAKFDVKKGPTTVIKMIK